MELTTQGIPFKPQVELGLIYKGQSLRKVYIPDFIFYEKIIVEIKAVRLLEDRERAQLQNYLKASGHKIGLLVNFGHYPKVQYERIIR